MSSATHFMLAADFADDIRFRLAGTRVCALFTREIKGEAFNAQWSESSREHIAELLAAVIDEKVGAVAGIIGRTETGDEVELELLLLPLSHAGQRAFARSAYWLPSRHLIGWANARLLNLS